MGIGAAEGIVRALKHYRIAQQRMSVAMSLCLLNG